MLNHHNVVITSLAVPIICDQLKNFFKQVPPFVRVRHDATSPKKLHLCFKPATCCTEEDEVIHYGEGFQILWNPDKDVVLAGTVVDADPVEKKLLFKYP